MTVLRKRACEIKLQADIIAIRQRYFHTKEWLIDELDFQTLVFGRQFLENKASLPLQGKWIAFAINNAINNEIQALGWKLEFQMTYADHSKPDIFPTLKRLFWQ